jgi:16S rRNA (guanine1207-N2)-methyltransferase
MGHYYDFEPKVASKEHEICFELNGVKFSLYTDNGVFSKKRVDEGSIAFLKTILPLSLGNKILDLGCGYGTIGLTISYFHKEARVDLADINSRALALCTKNAVRVGVNDRVTILQSNIYENIEGPYDSIVVNPPIRAGKVVTYAMYDGAKQYLIDGGSLFVVIRKAQGAESVRNYLKQLFGNCELLDRHKGYHILQAKKTNK